MCEASVRARRDGKVNCTDLAVHGALRGHRFRNEDATFHSVLGSGKGGYIIYVLSHSIWSQAFPREDARAVTPLNCVSCKVRTRLYHLKYQN